MKAIRTVAALAFIAVISATAAARAADLSMGIAVEPDSIDPHFHLFGGDLNVSFQISSRWSASAPTASWHPASRNPGSRSTTPAGNSCCVRA